MSLETATQETKMANSKLATIAHRQRSYLIRDLALAVFMALLVYFQVSAFTASTEVAEVRARPAALTAGQASGASTPATTVCADLSIIC